MAGIEIPTDKLAAFCDRRDIAELALFGSVLHDDFRPDSDIDILYTFKPDHRWSLLYAIDMREELEAIFGRKVDFVSKRGVEQSRNSIRRRSILGSARVIYPVSSIRPRDRTCLIDILNAARLVRQFVTGVSFDEFQTDVMRHSAVQRQLEIMGEATKCLSAELRAAHPELPWRQIAGLRDILTYAYSNIDLAQVWRIATTAVPETVAVLDPLLASEETRLPAIAYSRSSK